MLLGAAGEEKTTVSSVDMENMGRATGFEPASGPWQGPILATGRRPQYGAEYESPTRLAGLEDQCLRRSANPA